MTSIYHPRWPKEKVGLSSCLLLVLAFFVWRPEDAFVTTPLLSPKVTRTSLLPRFAEAQAEDSDEEMESDEEESDEEEEEEVVLKKYEEYAFDEAVPKQWYEKRAIDRHKVNMLLFDEQKKEKNFFPHKLQAGDTVRMYYLEAKPGFNEKETDKMGFARPRVGPRIMKSELKESYIDGTILSIRGEYLDRSMKLRSSVGTGSNMVGYEWDFPIHSPMVTKIQVIRRGFLGRQKSAMFMRMLVGKKNQIPLDAERTQMDKEYKYLRQVKRDDEIPESNYPRPPWDQYPLPVWRQDQDDWKEEDYDELKVDDRTDFERVIIGNYGYRRKENGKYGHPSR